MSDYIVWCPGRCGSHLAAYVLQAALYPEQPIYFDTYDGKIHSSNHAIVHTHSIRYFIEGSGRKIAISRNIFDAAISMMIANKTTVFHLYDETDRRSFDDKFSQHVFCIDEDEFVQTCRFYDRCYTSVSNNVFNATTISYEQFKADPFKLLKLLDIDKKSWKLHNMLNSKLTTRIPIDKATQVSNYYHLKEIFDGLDLRYKDGLI